MMKSEISVHLHDFFFAYESQTTAAILTPASFAAITSEIASPTITPDPAGGQSAA